MSGTPRAGTARVLALPLTVALLGLALLAGRAPTAAAEPAPTALSVEYQTLVAGPGEQVGVTGSVTIGGQPGPAGVPVDVTFDGEQVLATIETGEGGMLRGSFAVPDDARPGDRQLLAMIEGDDTRNAAVQGDLLQITGRRAQTALTAQVDPAPVDQGQPVRVSGQVTRGDGRPTGRVSVEVLGGAAADHLDTIDTDDQGRFDAQVTVPPGAGDAGDFPAYPLLISFEGTDALTGAEQPLTLTLNRPPDPQAEAQTDEPAPAPEEATPSESATVAAAPGQDSARPSELTLVPVWVWFIVGAGFVAVVGAAMIAHRRRPDENSRLLP